MTVTVFLLQAAAYAATALGDQGASRGDADASYKATASGGLYRADDLRLGEQVLIDAHLLRDEGGQLVPSDRLLPIRRAPVDVAAELILRELLLVEQPLWLWAAVHGSDLQWEHVPDRDQQLVEHLIDAERREAYLLSIARTVDAEALGRAGRVGEEIVAAACRTYLEQQGRSDLATTVAHVSEVSDDLGYDITSPDTGGRRHRIEVKAVSAHLTTVSFFISRNEATQAARDPLWSLVVVAAQLDQPIVGWVAGAAFLHWLPVDVATEHARWWSARVTLDVTALTPGLPLDAR
ncbi:protein NO VEIN domain-containing protein [Curtobacterium sp. VKM Ac-2922]|uniref:protein NO VEIN domain-containing protein n=1 Tax=Curtobacterium sp. VKM Ac-2922 TaxID=2929475 RepID=UPI001FB1B8C2|nr:DUF3883 domain-containing protein [Curtobacterium sp. VKM Ac-2922]MCJ1715099.1 DUF3883 domain-containing protein [Curtobacterium sp. VKM Ac-2922]